MSRKVINIQFAAIITVIVLTFSCLTHAEKPNIAVNDLQAQGIEFSEAAIITDRLRSEIFKTGAYTVLERGQMEEVLKEQGFQQSGCVADACIVEAGQLLGVQYMVAGTIGKIGQTYTLNVRLIDVATGKITGTAVTDCKCDIDEVLSSSTTEIAVKLIKESGEKVQEGETEDIDSNATERASVESSADPVPDNTFRPSAGSKKQSIWPRIALGIAAAGAVSYGVLLNSQAKDALDESDRIKREYENSGSDLNYDSYSESYSSELDKASSKASLRNVFYGLAGVCTAGIFITLTF